MDEEKKWYDGEPTGEIPDFIALEKTYRVDSLISALRTKLEHRIEASVELSAPERLIVVVDTFETAINGEGLVSFFENSDKKLIADTPVALSTIKAQEVCKLVLVAIDIAGGKAFFTKDVEFTEKAKKALGDLEDVHRAAGGTLTDSLWSIVKANESAFTLD